MKLLLLLLMVEMLLMLLYCCGNRRRGWYKFIVRRDKRLVLLLLLLMFFDSRSRKVEYVSICRNFGHVVIVIAQIVRRLRFDSSRCCDRLELLLLANSFWALGHSFERSPGRLKRRHTDRVLRATVRVAERRLMMVVAMVEHACSWWLFPMWNTAA